MAHKRSSGPRARNALATLAGLIVVLGGVGCASAVPDERAVPTHRWVSKTVESQAQYHYDNKECAVAAGDESVADGVGKGESLRRDAPAFVAYERCMGERGYQLATY